MTISVVIPGYNVISGKGERVLRTVLDAILAQERAPDEIILSDSSTDGTGEFVSANYPHVSMAHSSARMYAGVARNNGVAVASGDVVAFLDADCAPCPGWLGALERAYVDRGAVAVTGPLGGPPNENAYSRMDRILHLNHLARLWTAHETSRASTSNFSVRRDVFLSLGGFPDVAANEDAIFTSKLVEAHGPIAVAPDAIVYHLSPSTPEALLHHQRRFGCGFVDGRREDPSLPGAFAIRHPALVPLLPLIRGSAIISRLARHNRRDLATLMSHPLLFTRALAAWTRGIRDGLRGDEVEWDLQSEDHARDEHAPSRATTESGQS